MTYSILDEKIREIQPIFFDGLKRIMQINSVKGTPEPNAPFGNGRQYSRHGSNTSDPYFRMRRMFSRNWHR